MKRLALFFLFLALALGYCTVTFAAGSWTYSGPSYAGQTRVACIFTFTGDSSTGSVPAYTMPSACAPPGYYLLSTESLAGSTAPTSGWSFTVPDVMGVDLMTGNGTSQSTSTTVGVVTMPGKWVPVMESPTLNVSGNSVASGTARIRAIFTSN